MATGYTYALTPPAKPGRMWTEKTLIDFAGAGGIEPRGRLTIEAGGTLIGTASSGGIMGAGVAFRLVPPSKPGGAWSETVLHSFSGEGTAGGGYLLGGLIRDAAGNLYGAAYDGDKFNSGTVFRLEP